MNKERPNILESCPQDHSFAVAVQVVSECDSDSIPDDQLSIENVGSSAVVDVLTVNHYPASSPDFYPEQGPLDYLSFDQTKTEEEFISPKPLPPTVLAKQVTSSAHLRESLYGANTQSVAVSLPRIPESIISNPIFPAILVCLGLVSLVTGSLKKRRPRDSLLSLSTSQTGREALTPLEPTIVSNTQGQLSGKVVRPSPQVIPTLNPIERQYVCTFLSLFLVAICSSAIQTLIVNQLQPNHQKIQRLANTDQRLMPIPSTDHSATKNQANLPRVIISENLRKNLITLDVDAQWFTYTLEYYQNLAQVPLIVNGTHSNISTELSFDDKKSVLVYLNQLHKIIPVIRIAQMFGIPPEKIYLAGEIKNIGGYFDNYTVVLARHNTIWDPPTFTHEILAHGSLTNSDEHGFIEALPLVFRDNPDALVRLPINQLYDTAQSLNEKDLKNIGLTNYSKKSTAREWGSTASEVLVSDSTPGTEFEKARTRKIILGIWASRNLYFADLEVQEIFADLRRLNASDAEIGSQTTQLLERISRFQLSRSVSSSIDVDPEVLEYRLCYEQVLARVPNTVYSLKLKEAGIVVCISVIVIVGWLASCMFILNARAISQQIFPHLKKPNT
jgi:hypothetical protein